MNSKSEVEKLFQEFYTLVETQFHTKISILRSDNGTEYFNQYLGNFLKQKGVQHQSTCRHTPQQNGVAERKNRHLLEVCRALMISMHVPKYLWGDSVLTATYLINRVPSRILSHKTPIHCLKQFFPNNRLISNLPLKVFGSTVFVHIPDLLRSKLDARAEKCVFIGYPPNKKGYKCFNPLTKKTHISMDVTFFEQKPCFSKTHLQGENENKDEFEFENLLETNLPVLETNNSVLPNPFFPNTSHKETVFEKETSVNEQQSGTNMVPDLTDSSPGRETLLGEDPNQDNHPTTELLVYTRRKSHANREHPHLVQDQSAFPRSDPDLLTDKHKPGNTSDSQSISITHLPSTSQPNVLSDLDIPIANRKGVWKCTIHPIAKYLSYHKLSENYKAFTSKISHLVIPRNIVESLGHPNWKVAVMEEMNALAKIKPGLLMSYQKGRKLWDVSGFSQINVEPTDP